MRATEIIIKKRDRGELTPEECLSTAMFTTPVKSRTCPERTIAMVRSVVSRGVMPFRSTAMAQAETW